MGFRTQMCSIYRICSFEWEVGFQTFELKRHHAERLCLKKNQDQVKQIQGSCSSGGCFKSSEFGSLGLYGDF